MKCDECTREFTVDAGELDGAQRTVCYDCELAWLRETAPELLGGICPHCGSMQCWGTVEGVMTCCVTGKAV